MASKEQAQSFVEEITRKLGDPSEYVFLIPGWEPVDSEQGIWWVTSQLWEGFYVKYRIEQVTKQVSLQSWEFGDDEPAW